MSLDNLCCMSGFRVEVVSEAPTPEEVINSIEDHVRIDQDDVVNDGDITEKRGTKRKAETQEVTHTPSGTPSGTCSGTPQIEWESIWEMYTAAADTHVENGTENCVSDSIYDLVSSVVKDGVGYACIDPTVAMVKAKSYWSTLPLEQQNQQLKGKWKWSPQSTKTSELLVEVYGNLDAAYTVGWRWYPEPVRITRDTHISQMPDLSLRLL